MDGQYSFSAMYRVRQEKEVVTLVDVCLQVLIPDAIWL